MNTTTFKASFIAVSIFLTSSLVGLNAFGADNYEPEPLRSFKSISKPEPVREKGPLFSMYNGFRVGAIVLAGGVPESLAERGMAWPMTTVFGGETVQRVRANENMHFIIVGNLLAGGFDQDIFFINANAAAGVDLYQQFQFGMGINATPGSENGTFHSVYFASYSHKLDDEVFMPITFTAVPDKNGHHRFGISIGFNWQTEYKN